MVADRTVATRSFSAGHYFSWTKRPATSSPAVTRETNRSWAIHVSLLLLGSLSLHVGKGTGREHYQPRIDFQLLERILRADSDLFPRALIHQRPAGNRHTAVAGEEMGLRVNDVQTRHPYLFPLPCLLLSAWKRKRMSRKVDRHIRSTFGHLFNLWKQHEIENQSMRLPTGSFTSSFLIATGD